MNKCFISTYTFFKSFCEMVFILAILIIFSLIVCSFIVEVLSG